MKRRSNSSQESDKSKESAPPRKPDKFTFDFNNNIECFLSTSQRKLHHSHSPSRKSSSKLAPDPVPLHQKELSLSVPRKNRGLLVSNNQQPFNNKILLLEYEGEEESKHDNKQVSIESGKDSKSDEQDQAVKAVVNSCLQVITEDTENSSNPVSARYGSQLQAVSTGTMEGARQMQIMQMQLQMQMQMQYSFEMQVQMQMMMSANQEGHYGMRKPAPRNRRAVSSQQQHNYIVWPNKVAIDNRTTVMIRNIPNKYTQQMLLELFEVNHKKKFDFFYLPIDYSNNCNVGYAFLNFIHAKFIVQFYHEFHNHKWKLFNSDKVCKVCYARIQGTEQLERHFKNSNVIQQQDHRFRPLIGMESLEGVGISGMAEHKERKE